MPHDVDADDEQRKWQLGPIGMTNTVSLSTLPRSSAATDIGNGTHLQPDVELRV